MVQFYIHEYSRYKTEIIHEYSRIYTMNILEYSWIIHGQESRVYVLTHFLSVELENLLPIIKLISWEDPLRLEFFLSWFCRITQNSIIYFNIFKLSWYI